MGEWEMTLQLLSGYLNQASHIGQIVQRGLTFDSNGI